MIASGQKGKQRIICRQNCWMFAFGTASTLMLVSSLLLPGLAQGYHQNYDKNKITRQNSAGDQSSSWGGYVRSSTPVNGMLRPNAYNNATGVARRTSSRRPDAEAGVELLESIFNRVMNIPQVALTKSTTTQIVAQNLKQNSFSQTGQGIDYKLAIRPKEQGKVFAAPSPSLQIAQASEAPSIAAGLSAGLASNTANFGARQSLASLPTVRAGLHLQENTFGDEGAAAVPSASPTAEMWKGGSLSKLSSKPELSHAADDKPGVWEDGAGFSAGQQQQGGALPHKLAYGGTLHGASADAFGSAGGGAGVSYGRSAMPAPPSAPSWRGPESEESSAPKKKTRDLSSSVGRLYNLSKRLEEAQAMGERADKAHEQVMELKSRVAQAKMRGMQQMPDARANSFYNAPRQVEIIDERPVVKDFRESAKNESDSLMDSISPSRRRGVTNTGIVLNKVEKKSEAAKEKADYDASPRSGAKDKLALLPPNVVTGIPLGNVSLGKSEAQVISSLGAIGKLTQRKVKNWTVYSWAKVPGDGSDALQLYFRHGMLDAIRIFDSSLVGTDFGVSPGDRLEEVKERFGEPSFLLAEPGSMSGGKNYIYPISQVAFQLARTSDSSPQVVSVLIFSVK